MNFIGKLFVLIYGAGSVLCLAVAIAIYTQKMDFVTPQGEDPKKVKNRVELAIEQTKDLIKANNRAYTRWLQEYDDVVRIEVEQFQRREFYRGQIELVTTGKLEGVDKNDPVQVLERDDVGRKMLKIDMPTGRPSVKVANGENAKPQSAYAEGLEGAANEINGIDGLLTQTNKLIAETSKTTAEIGQLRTRIDQKILIAAEADAETLYLEDFITTRRADAQLYVKRRDALEASIARLEEYLKKRAGGQGN